MRVLHTITVVVDEHDGKTKVQTTEESVTCAELVKALEMVVIDCALMADRHGLSLFETASRFPSFVTAPHWPHDVKPSQVRA